MRTAITAYVSGLVVMAVLDAIWLTFATSRIYRPGIGHLMAAKPTMSAAVIFYLLYVAGLTYLVTLPAATSGGFSVALTRGAVLGLIAYATYDLTSLAILRDWPVGVTVIDMVWGAILTGVTAGVAVLLTQRFG